VTFTYKRLAFGEEYWEVSADGQLRSSGFWSGRWKTLADGGVEVRQGSHAFVVDARPGDFGELEFRGRPFPYVEGKGRRQRPLQESPKYDWRREPAAASQDPVVGDWYAWHEGFLVKISFLPGGQLWDSRRYFSELSWRPTDNAPSYESFSAEVRQGLWSIDDGCLRFRPDEAHSSQGEMTLLRSSHCDYEIVGNWELKIKQPDVLVGFQDGLTAFRGSFRWDGRKNWQGQVDLQGVSQAPTTGLGKLSSIEPFRGRFGLELNHGKKVFVRVENERMTITDPDRPEVTLAEGQYHSPLEAIYTRHPSQLSRHEVGTIYDLLAKAERAERQKRPDFQDPILGVWYLVQGGRCVSRCAFDAFGQVFWNRVAGMWELVENGRYALTLHHLSGFSKVMAELSPEGELRMEDDCEVFRRLKPLSQVDRPLQWQDEDDRYLYEIERRERKEHPHLK
jgi:hypothetical protein